MKLALNLLNIFSIPRVDNCCFCISLRTGSLVLGWFGVVANLFGLFVCTLEMLGVETAQNDHPQRDMPPLFLDKDEQEKRNNLLQLSYAIFGLMCLMDIITNSLFLFGVYKRRPALIAQWLVSSIIWLMLAVIGQLFRIFAKSETDSYTLVQAFVLSFFVFGLRFYWWLSVYSVYDLVKAGKPLEQSYEIDDNDEDDEERAINKE